MKLSKLIKVPLRNIWKHEALNFTKWLVEEENLALLSETISINLANPQTEVRVGKFSADILAYDEESNRRVIIENQIETTNHDHLGKMITYASGHKAEVCIWIVARARQEHEQAIQWLNENTSEAINFFLIEVEAWKIGNSSPAAKFNVIAKPNSWAKTFKQEGGQSRKVTDLKLQQKDFWEKVREYGEKSSEQVSSWQSPRPQSWYDIRSFGSIKATLRAMVNSQKSYVVIDLYIPDDTDLFHALKVKQSDIESELGYELEWQELPKKKASTIGIKQSGDFRDEEQQNMLAKWVVGKIDEFTRVFRVFL